VNTHFYLADATVAPDHHGERPCAYPWCGSMPKASVHRVPDVSDAQAEQRRRIGEER
jgi:hypothetical protein